MTSTLNPHFISELEATPTNQITDAVDSIHSGIVKALHLAARGTYALKDTGADFDITQSSYSSVTRLAVKGGKAYRDGVLVTLGGGSGSTNNIDCTNTYDPGTGQVDVTPVSGGDVYLFLVGNSSDALVLRGTNGTTGKVPELVEGDVPIAIVKVVASSDDDAINRPIQYLTTSKVSNAISLGYNSSGYTEMSKITAASGGTTVEVGTAGGDFIIDNTDADKKIVMRLGSDDANTDFEVRNNSDAAKFSVDALGDTVVGRDLTITGGDINYSNAQVATLGVTTSGSGTVGRDLTISAGSTTAASGNTDGGDLILKSGFADGTGSSFIGFHTSTATSDSAVAERMRIHTNGMVGIAETAPIAPLHIKYAESDDATPALLLESTNAGGVSSPDIKLYRNSSSPADNDYIGHLVFTGNTLHASNGSVVTTNFDYAHIYGIISDATDGTEDGTLAFRTKVAGQNVDVMTIKGGNVGIGETSPDSLLEISKDTDAELIGLKLTNQSDAADTTGKVSIQFDLEDTGGNAVDSGKIQVLKEQSFTATGSTQDSAMVFSTSLNGTLTEAVRITSDGKLRVAGNVIQASDGGATITMDTSDNVSAGGALTAGTTVTATTGLLTNGYFSNGAFEDIYSGSGTDAIVADKSVIISTDAGGATKQYTLPSASGLSGRTITFKNVGTGNTTIAPVSGSEKIDHDATTHALIGTSNLITLPPWQSITLMAFSDGLISQGPAAGTTGWLTLN